MKGIDLFCASTASTAICVDQRSSMVRHSCSSSSRAIDRHNPHLSDRRRRSSSSSSSRTITSSSTNTSSHQKFSTATSKHKHNHHHHHHQNEKSRKSSSLSGTNNKKKPTIELSPTGSSRYLLSDDTNNSLNVLSDHEFDPVSALVPLEPPPSSSKPHASISLEQSSKSRSLVSLEPPPSSSKPHASISLEQLSKSRSLVSLEPSLKSHVSVASEQSPKSRKPSSKSPASVPFIHEPSPSRTRALVPYKHPPRSRQSVISSDKSLALLPPSSSTRRSPGHQVVVLRVSLHCKGCEGKVRKHISRMQGVTSFNIDFVTKKVTVIGDVTPMDVLASVSKVKNAQFWPSQWSTSQLPSSIPSTY